MESLAAYIPVDRRHAMAKGQSLPDRGNGAVLFADISGFSALTDVLLRELGSRRGAEEMTRQLILVYTALIAELHRYRGSVIGFAGDSITCWLEADDGHRAVACALAMQQAMEQFAQVQTPAGTTLSITVKIAIAAGPVRRFAVGDPQIQVMDVLAGSTLDRVALAEQYSERREVVVGEEVAAALGDDLEIAAWRKDEESGRRFAVAGRLLAEVAADPWPELPPGSLSAEQERPWLLPAVYEKLRTGRDQYFAELRPAVPMFLRFTGLDYDNDSTAGEKLDQYIRWVQQVTSRYEAHIIQLTIGDKGSYLYIPFGVPIAHDDDAARAVAAALELRTLPPDLDCIHQVQIGISQGRVWAGACGSVLRRTYAAMGNEVNMAARLMSRAQPGQIMVSQRVIESAGKLYDFKPLGAITVKGRQEAMPVYLVEDKRPGSAAPAPAVLYTDPLVGRQETLAHLEEILATAAGGSGQIIQIEGPVGIGKSHLAAVFGEQAGRQGWLVATGACQSIAQDTAYYPWQQLFRTLLVIEGEPAGAENQAAFLARQVGRLEAIISSTNPDWQVRLPLLGDLLGLPIPDNPTTAALEPRLRQRALFALVAEIVETWSQARPLVFLLEDAHWMDEASIGLSNALGYAIAHLPVCILFVHRPLSSSGSSQQTRLPDFSSLPYYDHLELGELLPAGIATLISSRLQGRPAELTLAFIQAKAQGNPFFAAELVNNLRESARLVRRENGEWWLANDVFEALRHNDCLVKQNGQWLLAENAPLSAVDLGLPASIQGTVLSRMDRLPESHKLTLKVASVVGRQFRLDLLASSHPSQPAAEAIHTQVEEIEARDFVRQERSQAQLVPVYHFKHNVTQEVAYETLLFTQRQQLHQAVGRSLEQLQPDEIEQIAYHTYVGEDWERALHYQILAGREAQQHFANQEAVDHYQKALHCAEQLPAAATAAERLDIHITLGELFVTTGQYEAAQEQLNQALTLAKERNDSEAQARACRWFARLHENRGEYQPALEWVQKGLLALVSQETAQVAELLLIAGLINTRQGDYDNATALCEHSLVIGQKLGDLSVLARAYNLMGIITRSRGNTTTAINHFQNSFQLYEQVNDIHGQARSHNEIANAYFYTGQWTKADHHYRAARHIFKQVGNVYSQIVVDNNLGGIARNQGRLDDALAFYRQALQAQQQIGGSLWILGVLNMNLGQTYIQRGELEAAYQHLRHSEAYFGRAQARDFLPEMHRNFGEAALRTGDLAAAESHAQKSKELASEMGLRSEEGNSLRLLGDITAAAGRPVAAESHLNQSLVILQEVGDQFEWARSQLSLARLYEQWGKDEQARAALAHCLPILEQLDAALEVTKARELQERLVIGD